jgi:serine/threonine-protein kinase RsbW
MMHPHHKECPFHTRTVDLAQEPHTLQIQLHSPTQLHPFSESLAAWMRTVGYSPKDIFAVRLALYEAVLNAFRHGNRCDAGKRIFVRYLLSAAEVLLEVEDQGRGFDPDQVPDPLTEPCHDRPGGRGLFLMRTYMTWVSFNREGNRVTFCRQHSNY